MLFTNLRKRKLFTKSIFSQSLQPFTTQNLLLIFKFRSGRSGRKGTFLALCFFPWARVEISRVSRARRVRKQATIKFDQWFIYKLISLHDLHAKSPRAPRGKSTGLKRCPFCPICPWKSTINFVLQIVLLIWKVKGCNDCEKIDFVNNFRFLKFANSILYKRVS